MHVHDIDMSVSKVDRCDTMQLKIGQEDQPACHRILSQRLALINRSAKTTRSTTHTVE